jgi:hypothetical protein
MPEVEAGDGKPYPPPQTYPAQKLTKPKALPGMGAGGAAAPIASNAEEFGVNEPKKDPLDDNDEAEAVDESTTTSSTKKDSSSKKRTEPHHSATSPERSQLDQKFTKLDKDEVDMSTSSTKGQEMDARAQRVADAVGKSKGAGDEVVKKNGGHADVEELHGATSLEHGDRSKDGGHGGKKSESGGGSGKKSEGGNGSGKKSDGASGGASGKGGKGEVHGEATLGEKIQREQAKKFGVNLEE